MRAKRNLRNLRAALENEEPIRPARSVRGSEPLDGFVVGLDDNWAPVGTGEPLVFHPHDERDEVVLPGELVDRILELRARDQRRDGFDLVQAETDLGLGDTVRALELCERAGRRR